MNEFIRKVVKSKTISDRGKFMVSLVEVAREKFEINTEAIGNPPQGQTIEMQSSFPKGAEWKHTVWVRKDMHEEFFKAYLDMVKEAGWELPNHELITQLVHSKDLGEQKLDIEEIIKNPTQARQIMASIGSIRDNQTKDYRVDLAELSKLLNDRSNETNIHMFLKAKPWIFGIDYISQAIKDKFQVEFGEFDFLLERFNKVYDIVELKGVNATLFDSYRVSQAKQGERIRWKLSEDLSGAILQVLDYFDEFERMRINEDTRSKRGIRNYRNPRGQIIIGHREDLKPDQEALLNKLNEKFSSIDILTFSDLYDRAQYFVELLENSIFSNQKV